MAPSMCITRSSSPLSQQLFESSSFFIFKMYFGGGGCVFMFVFGSGVVVVGGWNTEGPYITSYVLRVNETIDFCFLQLKQYSLNK